ncbi:helix-turn-helix domain-containing protein [Intestinibacillus massiliensis]
MEERIKELRMHLGLSQEEFGKRVGVTRGVIANIELCRASVKPLLIEHICEVFGVNEDWILSGAGDMFAPMSKDEEFHQIITDIEFSGDETIKDLLRAYWNLDEKEKAVIRKLIDGLRK